MNGFIENLHNPENAATLLCIESGKVFRVGDVCPDIGRLSPVLRPYDRIAIHCQSARLFLIALTAAWRAGSTVIFPATDRAAYLDAIADRFDLYLDDAAILEKLSAPCLPPSENDTLPNAQDCRAVFFTSGSTGAPKPVHKNLAQIEAEISVQEPLWQPRIPTDAKIAGLVSHQHIYGLIFRIIWPVMTKRAFSADPAAYWEMMQGDLRDGDVLITSPAHLKNLHPDLVNVPRPSMIFSSGGPLDLTSARETTEMLGTCPTEIYGSTETGGIAHRQQMDANSIWLPLPGVDIGLNDAGCLRVRARYIAGDDWYQTEDIADIDTKTGCFRLRGRADRVVKIEGKRISLGAVERHLRNCDLVEDAIALLPDENDHRLGVVAVLTPAGCDMLDDIGRFRMGRQLRREIAKFEDDAALPQRWRFVEHLPSDSQGKRPLHLLRALFADKEPGPPEIVIQSRDGDRVNLSLHLSADLVYFHGHFPDMPILPGVVQLHWAVHQAATIFDIPVTIGEVAQLKYRKPITPGSNVMLELDCDRKNAKVKFRYYSVTEGDHSSGILKWREVFA
ncbi:AMP-binding protein [Thalassospira sp.]|uniref:AMP-binding protein n=1 Tax=Thalassospira sp. TaxID=1912094 RepID=UPI002736E0EB|nr:AMP-binding protein [Thalassospira sp.]MDP2698564.1 AMP-binding protein [Thalassospira sp.]